MLDIQISEMESKLRDLKKIRNKEIEPQLTDFMVQYNITDLNTESGKLKCSARNSKKPLNKENIKNNVNPKISRCLTAICIYFFFIINRLMINPTCHHTIRQENQSRE